MSMYTSPSYPLPDSGTPVPARTAEPAGRISSIASSDAASRRPRAVGVGVGAASVTSRRARQPGSEERRDERQGDDRDMPNQGDVVRLTGCGPRKVPGRPETTPAC